MKIFFSILKVILILLFLSYTSYIVFTLFFSNKEKRFEIAEHQQGVMLSQTMFKVLTFQYPAYSDAYFEQSVPFNKRGDFATGFDLLNKAVALDPTGHLGYRGYMKLRFLRDYKNALIDLNTLDSLTPNFSDAPWGEDIDFLRGECYVGMKEYQKAIGCFNRNIKENKEDWVDLNTFVYLGICEHELGNYKRAIVAYKRALKQSMYTPEAHFGLAKIYLKLDDLVKVNEHLLKAEKWIDYKREDRYKEFQNEIYLWEITEFKNNVIVQ